MKKIMMSAIIFIIIMLASIISGDKENKAEPNIINIDVANDKEDDKNEDKSLELMKLAEEEYAHNDIDDKKQNIKEEKIHTANRGGYREVPKSNTSMKSYMDYKAIKDTTSKQYELLQRDDVYIDEEGFLRIDGKYLIAIGTFYADEIGQDLEITLSTGRKIKAIVGDFKKNKDTDNKNQQHKKDGSVIEFIVNVKNKKDEYYPTINKLSRKMGNMSYAERANLDGDIVSIKVLDK